MTGEQPQPRDVVIGLVLMASLVLMSVALGPVLGIGVTLLVVYHVAQS